MLVDLKIRNFTIIHELDITFANGMSVLTGETGAGKSVLVDAIELALGERADLRLIRQGEDRCEISLYFDVLDNQPVKTWLVEHGLDQGNDCIIRRTLSQDGRSRCYINDQMVSLTRIKEISAFLLSIHGQHQNQLLFDMHHQREQVDSYLNDSDLLLQVRQHYQQWQNLLQTEKALQEKLAEAQTKIDFVNYQLTELNALQVAEGELEKLMGQQKQLSHREQWLRDGQTALQKMAMCESEIFKAHGCLKNAITLSKPLENIGVLLESAHISIQEANRELENYLEELTAEPETLQAIEQRLSDIYNAARKYRVAPEELVSLQTRLTQELNALNSIDVQREKLTAEICEAKTLYEKYASQLTQQRSVIAKKMAKQVTCYLPELNMVNADFQIKLVPIAPSVYGLERVEFWVSTNLGQALQPLEKVVSGGELSRLNLAIQAVFAKREQTPVLIFDEIDTGMGGAAAEQVGRLMRLLSEKTQVIAITHLPQVAVNAQHHYVVEKTTVKKTTHTQLKKLSSDERTQEVARMLGGLKITDRTLAHARELLEQEQ